MKVLFSICSEGVSVDRYTNKLSIFSVVDRLASTAFPMWLPKLCVSLAVTRDENDPSVIHGRVLMTLDDKLIGAATAVLPFQADGIARIVINSKLAIPAPGTISIWLESEGEKRLISQIAAEQIALQDIPVVETPGIHTLEETPPPS